MLTKDKLVCGCDDPYCLLPVEEDPAKIIEDVEKDYKPIAEGCKSKQPGLTSNKVSEEVYESMIP